MSSSDIDSYLENIPLEQRTVLRELRRTILRYAPDAQEGISYRIPAFRVDGAVVAGFASFKHHMSYLPFSGSVLAELSDEISCYAHTKSSLHFTLDNPLADALIERLLSVRRTEIRVRGR
ncbi:MAG: hypothetical protein JWM55_169 [Acidimicrobiaceae bacterium]|nr:hypothetical protein [Acidimicrobiaceae bacterium]